MQPGICAGFTAEDAAHQLVNRTSSDVTYLEIGGRTQGDEVIYPADDLQAVFDENGKWRFLHKGGAPYENSNLSF